MLVTLCLQEATNQYLVPREAARRAMQRQQPKKVMKTILRFSRFMVAVLLVTLFMDVSLYPTRILANYYWLSIHRNICVCIM